MHDPTLVALTTWYPVTAPTTTAPEAATSDAALRLAGRGFATLQKGRASLRVYRRANIATDGLEPTIRIQFRRRGPHLQVRYRHDMRGGFLLWVALVPFLALGWFMDSFHRKRLATDVHRILFVPSAPVWRGGLSDGTN